jgi:hypothetical protein
MRYMIKSSVESLVSFLGTLGFILKSKGYVNYVYDHEEYPGGYSHEYTSFTSVEEYLEYGLHSKNFRIYEITGTVFVRPPSTVDVEFSMDTYNGTVTAFLNTKKIPTSPRRLFKRNKAPYEGKFEKNWSFVGDVEDNFAEWFDSVAPELAELSRSLEEKDANQIS